MNIDIINIDYYRVTNHGGKTYTLCDSLRGRAFFIRADQFAWLNEQRSLEACNFVAYDAMRQGENVTDL